MLTPFTVIYKTGNTIDTTEVSAYSMIEAHNEFMSTVIRESPYTQRFTVLGIIPTEVFNLLPDASVFFGIFPY